MDVTYLLLHSSQTKMPECRVAHNSSDEPEILWHLKSRKGEPPNDPVLTAESTGGQETTADISKRFTLGLRFQGIFSILSGYWFIETSTNF